MSALRRRLHPLTWFATVVMAAFVLLQSVALVNAVPRSVGAWTEICTSDGMMRVSLDTGETVPADPSGHLGHCPLCHLAGDPVVAVLPGQPVWTLEPTEQDAPPAFLQAPRTLYAWASARARAPPSLLA